jgi:RING-type zinc-finger
MKCVNTKVGHAKGHQSQDGEQISQGEFCDNFNTLRQVFLESISDEVENFIRSIHEKGEKERPQRSFATERHRQTLRHPRCDNYWTGHYPLDTCLLCLCYSPQYILPCGHSFCENCVKDFGQREGNNQQSTTFVHNSCVLCLNSLQTAQRPWKISLRPKSAGVRILSLDGGGVRGVVELKILERIELEMGLGVPISDLFDLMVGTSSGWYLPGQFYCRSVAK